MTKRTVNGTKTRAIIMLLLYDYYCVLTNFNGFDSAVMRRVSTPAILSRNEMEICWALILIDLLLLHIMIRCSR